MLEYCSLKTEKLHDKLGGVWQVIDIDYDVDKPYGRMV